MPQLRNSIYIYIRIIYNLWDIELRAVPFHIILDFRMVSVFLALRGETGRVMLQRNALTEEALLEEIAREAMVCAVYVSIKIKYY